MMKRLSVAAVLALSAMSLSAARTPRVNYDETKVFPYELEDPLTFADGTKKLYGTDLENWKAGIAGPVKHAAIFDGEEYDAREKMGFECADKLSTPEVNAEFAGEILPSQGAEIYLRRDLALAPVKAYTWKDVENVKENEYGKVVIDRKYESGKTITLNPGETLVVDFGQNCAAIPEFTFKAKKGTILTCLPAEMLNDGNGARSRGMDGPEGSVHRENLRAHGDCFRVDYTFAGDKGFTEPELNEWALRKLKPQIEKAGATMGVSNSRTCEIGLSTHSGIDYCGIAHLVNMTSKSKQSN